MHYNTRLTKNQQHLNKHESHLWQVHMGLNVETYFPLIVWFNNCRHSHHRSNVSLRDQSTCYNPLSYGLLFHKFCIYNCFAQLKFYYIFHSPFLHFVQGQLSQQTQSQCFHHRLKYHSHFHCHRYHFVHQIHFPHQYLIHRVCICIVDQICIFILFLKDRFQLNASLC